ncbi:hypothetical protein HFD88_010228 [Aspergillus terreus]|nr:hypothetical protein HFD88_010228 [Aspergillus terreus]
MPKSKKARLHGPPPGAGGDAPQKKARKMHTFSKLSTKADAAPATKPKHTPQQQQQQRRPIVPFAKRDRILLVGEGDFSFARSLVEHHGCRHVLATCYDAQDTLYAKYPQAEGNVRAICGPRQNEDTDPAQDEPATTTSPRKSSSSRVLFSVDARKLGTPSGGGRDVRVGFPRRRRRRPAWLEAKLAKEGRLPSVPKGSDGPWDVICFNFPHVGGLSTDVNRQVRANQELLVGFFKACVPLLSARVEDGGVDEEEWEWEGGSEGESGSGSEDDGGGQRTEPGQILVSMFEGEPYTLWNIKDLARHAGLRVVTSFRFPWASYKGYSHARTVGEIEGKHGGRGGWRGEDREARMYVFEIKDDHPVSKPPSKAGKGKKRHASDSDDSD